MSGPLLLTSFFSSQRRDCLIWIHYILQIQSLYILLIISINNIINCSKACGPDLIPPSLLLLTFVFLFLNYLTSLCYQENYLRIGSLLKFVLCSRKVTHVSQAATDQLVLHLLLSKWWRGLFSARLGLLFLIAVGSVIISMVFGQIIPLFHCYWLWFMIRLFVLSVGVLHIASFRLC